MTSWSRFGKGKLGSIPRMKGDELGLLGTLGSFSVWSVKGTIWQHFVKGA
jgi:hypothetical protein